MSDNDADDSSSSEDVTRWVSLRDKWMSLLTRAREQSPQLLRGCFIPSQAVRPAAARAPKRVESSPSVKSEDIAESADEDDAGSSEQVEEEEEDSETEEKEMTPVPSGAHQINRLFRWRRLTLVFAAVF